MEFFEVRLVVAIDIVKSKGPHPLAEHPVIVLHLCVGGSIDLWVCGFWIGKQSLGRPGASLGKIVIDEMSFTNHACAITSLLQPCSKILVV